MSEATIQLLRSTDFIVAVLIGAVAVVGAVIWRGVTGKTLAIGGVVMVAGAGIGLAYTRGIPLTVVAGLVLLAVGGAIDVRSGVARFILALPGSATIAASMLATPGVYLPAVTAAAIMLFAPLVWSFDRRFAASTVAVPVAAATLVSIFFIVPDTEEALIVAGAAAVWLIAGPPSRAAGLGGAGAFAVTGLAVWTAVVGGAAVPGALVTGVGALGILLSVPVVEWFADRRRGATEGTRGTGLPSQYLSMVVLQIAVGLLMTVVVRFSGGSAAIAGLATVAVVAIAGVVAMAGWPSESRDTDDGLEEPAAR